MKTASIHSIPDLLAFGSSRHSYIIYSLKFIKCLYRWRKTISVYLQLELPIVILLVTHCVVALPSQLNIIRLILFDGPRSFNTDAAAWHYGMGNSIRTCSFGYVEPEPARFPRRLAASRYQGAVKWVLKGTKRHRSMR